MANGPFQDHLLSQTLSTRMKEKGSKCKNCLIPKAIQLSVLGTKLCARDMRHSPASISLPLFCSLLFILYRISSLFNKSEFYFFDFSLIY